MFLKAKVPFEYSGKKDFPVQLAKWVSEVFYEILPTNGYEIREEQIFTAFQLADAVCKKKVHFAEAGLGTGKTFAYLLTAVAYARFTGKPVVIACASTALQEQLAGANGDITTLSHLLGLNIDARMAKDPRQYICDIKVNRLIKPYVSKSNASLENVFHWAEKTNKGERSEMPNIHDNLWRQVAWDETMPCEMCSRRGFCKLIKAREHYRPAQDLIISDHGIFFDDLWTRDEKLAEGKLSLLPFYSAVIFDEGHKVILPALMRAGKQIVKEDIENMSYFLEQTQEARTSLISTAFAVELAVANFFSVLQNSLLQDERTNRIAVQLHDNLLEKAYTLYRALGELQREIQTEQELYIQSIATSQLQAYELRIDRTMTALNNFCSNDGRNTISWVDKKDGSFWVVPREISSLLNKNLFSKGLPVVFSSATLSADGNFTYISRTLGLAESSTSSVDSSFDFAKQVIVYLPQNPSVTSEEERFSLLIEHLASLLRFSEGKALILTNSPSEIKKIRTALKDFQFPFEILWEDQGERGCLIQRFRDEVSSVLVGSEFWEGIDIPGEALSLLVIWQLPFPPKDPLIEARRVEAVDQGLEPKILVDYPEMALKLKQGCGRLIRTKDDQGIIALMEPVMGMPWEKFVMNALPSGAKIVDDFNVLQGVIN